jgi:hypothetical protein
MTERGENVQKVYIIFAQSGAVVFTGAFDTVHFDGFIGIQQRHFFG